MVLAITLTIVLPGSFVACSSSPNAIDYTVPANVGRTKPIIETVNISDITESSATVIWRTDEEATSQVEYGKAPQVLDQNSNSEKLTTDHSATLKRLDMGTTYHLRVSSKDANGNEAVSEIDTFVTPRPVGCGIGNHAPDFTLKDIHGREVSLNDFKGKAVVLNFWYTTCSPCEKELPYWQEAFDKWSSDNNTVLLTIHYKGTARDVNAWMQNRRYTIPTLIDQNGDVVDKYCVFGVPQAIFIASDGSIQCRYFETFESCKEIQDQLDSLLSTTKVAKLQMFYTDRETGERVSGILGTLEYNLTGPTFNYDLNAGYLDRYTDYSLIYYSDPWPGKRAGTLIGSAKTDTMGNIELKSSVDLGMDLPDANDPSHPSHPSGAKLLLVLSANYDPYSKTIKLWRPNKYLWPAWDINYTDTDAP
jgi:peroxiredoxin